MKFLNQTTRLLLMIMAAILIACSGSSGNGSAPEASGLEPAPSFTPTDDEDLQSMVINTFTDSGKDITVTPTVLDFNEDSEISKDDEVTLSFTINNNSGSDRTFKFAFYSVSSGFSILSADEVNLGAWDDVTIPDGGSESFQIRFNAWVFGTQTTYLTVSADIDGYIRLPMRATVAGASDFRIIPASYLCSDENAPDVEFLDFKKVAYGITESRGIKVCNTGGEDIKINSAEIMQATSSYRSIAMAGNAFEEFIWTVEDQIESSFSLGIDPVATESFSEPNFISYDGSSLTPEGDYSAVINETGESVEDIIVKAGELLRLDINLKPSLDIEAPEGSLYEPVELNAKLRVKTSLGMIDLPLLGATGGKEPVLKMSYRTSGEELWREIDLNSDGSAIYFGDVDVFRDWVTDNYRSVEIKIDNVGSGNKQLEFFPASLVGYFEYTNEEAPLEEFPLRLDSGSSSVLAIRYLPTPEEVEDDSSWDFGQFYFDHTGGNGPHGKLAMVGEQQSGYAVELKFGGSELKREYGEAEAKNLCVMQIDDGGSDPTRHSFSVLNNNKQHPLTVNWSLSADADSEAAFTSTPSSGSFTVSPDSSGTFAVDLFAAAGTSEGSTVRGILSVTTAYPGDVESEYATELATREARDFTVPVQFQASSSGECLLGGGKVIGADSTGPITATLVVDRITMVMTSLIEAARNHPSFRFHLPLEIDFANKRARIAKAVPFVYDKNSPDYSPIKQFRSYAHQITNINGCAPLPSNPYQMEYEKGSWTGPGFECNGDGSITYSGKDGSNTIDTDTACLTNNGGEETVIDGVKWVVFYHDFVKFDTSGCEMEYYGKIATFAYRPDIEDFGDVFERSEAIPNGSEEDYEQIYGSFQFDSYIYFNQDGFQCGSKTYAKGNILEGDPDALKDCYAAIAERSDSTRKGGLLNECSYFNFIIDEGIVPADATSDNPDKDSWSGYGVYEPYVDEDGKVHETKYDLTLYNVRAQVFALSPGDRFSFFRHPGKLLYSPLSVTFTTKSIASESDEAGWKDLIGVDTRPNFDKNQIYLVNGDPYNIEQFWTEDGVNSEFSNVLDDTALEPGVNYGGYGKGTFRKCTQGGCDIIPGGWPINFDENNLTVFSGLGSFNGKGNTAPGFAKEDSSGKGKPLYFSLHACLVEGEADENQGCFSAKLDDAKMTYNDSSSDDDIDVVELYKEYGILPSGYPGDIEGTTAGDCANYLSMPESDPDSPDYDPYKYMACINYKIFTVDRDRFTNYYDSDKFYYQDDDYGSASCGYGM